MPALGTYRGIIGSGGADFFLLTGTTNSYMGGGSANTQSQSSDGLTWSAVISGTPGLPNDLDYYDSLFVGNFGGNSVYKRLIDASSWSSVTIPASFVIESLKCANGVWILGGYGSGPTDTKLYTSTDLITWTSRAVTVSGAGASKAITAISYGLGLWIIGTGNGRIMSSPDLVTWTDRGDLTGVDTREITDIAFNGIGRFCAISGSVDTNFIWTSTNGTSWTNIVGISSMRARRILYANGTWVAAGYDTGSAYLYIYSSPDGTTWTATFQGAGAQVRGISNTYYSIDFLSGIWLISGQGQTAGAVNTGFAYRTATPASTWAAVTGNPYSEANNPVSSFQGAMRAARNA